MNDPSPPTYDQTPPVAPSPTFATPFPIERAPTTPEEQLDWLRLARSENVGPVTFRRLMNRYTSAAAALAALPHLAGRGGKRAYAACPTEDAEAEMQAATEHGARMLPLGAPDYPAQLAGIYDPPPFLWLVGDADILLRPAVALIGARNASALGLRMARKLARELGEAGYLIVSGLARGVDAAAHEAALETGTVGVLAGGVDVLYPPENAELARKIGERGARVSEQVMGLQPQGRHFPRRNRIVSGLCKGVVVVEAAERSGTLITARCALEQGREAMATPGHPLDPRAGGCNALIRQGAALVSSAEDVMEALAQPRIVDLCEDSEPYLPPDDPAEPAVAPEDLALMLAELLSAGPVDLDELSRLTDAPAHAVSAAVLELELAGRAERRPGGLVARTAETF